MCHHFLTNISFEPTMQITRLSYPKLNFQLLLFHQKFDTFISHLNSCKNQIKPSYHTVSHISQRLESKRGVMIKNQVFVVKSSYSETNDCSCMLFLMIPLSVFGRNKKGYCGSVASYLTHFWLVMVKSHSSGGCTLQEVPLILWAHRVVKCNHRTVLF